MVTLQPDDPLAPALRDEIGGAIAAFLDRQGPLLADLGAHVEPLARLARTFLDGGKRLRPAFCVWGAAAAGAEVSPPLVTLAASLDLLHVSALVHDDVMDGSDTRRGLPSAHRWFETLHRDRAWLGEAETFGVAGSILLGDLLVVWSTQMADESGLDPAALAAASPLLHAMRWEVAAGQFLDITAQVQPFGDPVSMLSATERVVEYKSARYSVRRPVMIGAAAGAVLAGRDAAGTARLLDALGTFGSLVGRAFQYRDDVLGVFGDTDVTGKPAGDDLREGKRTVLIAETLARVDTTAAHRLQGLLGRPLADAEVAAARDIIRDSGALDRVEDHIADAVAGATTALTDAHAAGLVTDTGYNGLLHLMRAAVERDH